MLCLKRSLNECIWIDLEDGRRIEVTLIEICGLHSARIGFEADRNIKITRAELSGTHDERGRLIQCGGL